MRIAVLQLKLTAGKRISFHLRTENKRHQFDGPEASAADRLHADLMKEQYSDASQRAQVLRRHADAFSPPGFAAWLLQWTTDRSRDSVLCVHAKEPRLLRLPWSEMLNPAGVQRERFSVAMACEPDGEEPPEPKPCVCMLLAAWTELSGYALPGVLRELQVLPSKIDKEMIKLTTIPEPTRRELLEKFGTRNQDWVHLSPPSLIDHRGKLAVPVTMGTQGNKANSTGARFDAATLQEIVKAARRGGSVTMAVVNACHAGIQGCRTLAAGLNAVAIGWPALVSDDVAADFTFYYYQRLVEGMSPLMAVGSFARAMGTARTPVEVPVVWLPSPRWAAWRPLSGGPHEGGEAISVGPDLRTAEEASRGVAGRRADLEEAASDADGDTPQHHRRAAWGEAPSLARRATFAVPPASKGLRLEFRPRRAINPALLVNGREPIEHIRIESPREQEIHLRIECDTGANTSTFRKTIRLKKGFVPVPTGEIHFPALHELIERRAPRRRIGFTAALIDESGREAIVQTGNAIWMGANEWLDREDTWAFIPAFVNPFDDGVLKVFDLAKRVLRTIASPNDEFIGYGSETSSPSYVRTQMKAIFQTLRDDTVGLTYIAPPGSPLFEPSSTGSVGQVVRTHAEVVERKLGTCHDLALLLAACAEYIGIRPLIFIAPGHTCLGYWTNSHRQEQFWRKRNGGVRTFKFGENWMVSDRAEVVRLVKAKHIVPIEATFVCQRSRSFDDACEKCMKDQFEPVGRPLDVAVDIFQARREVQPV